jgi:REP element-mobilizing transposase RayT
MYFFTATINNWQKLLEPNEYKMIVINSLKWLSANKHTAVHAFVIMPNHIHVLWSPLGEHQTWENENKLISYTAHAFLKEMRRSTPEALKNFISTQKDRSYQFWKRRSRTIEVKSRIIALQKLDYIHRNPLQEKWKLVEDPASYYFSSIRFYENEMDDFGFLTHYADFI